MLAWLGYMNPHLLCYGFMYRAPVVMIVAVVTMIGMLVAKEAKKMIWSREMIVLVIFIAWMAITTTQAFYFDPAVEQLIKVCKIQILTAMALIMLTSRERIHQFIWIIVLSTRLLRREGRHLHHPARRRLPGAGPRKFLHRQATTSWRWRW